MVKFTRQHYVAIGDTVKKLPQKAKQKEFERWDKIFKADNPRYDSYRFAKHIGLIK